MTAGERAAAAAQACVGARFRPHGRTPAGGLDCVGVAALALRAAGWPGRVPHGYALRTGALATVPEGLSRCDGSRVGDVLLCRVAATQLHLLVRVMDGTVHADAAARRVVERPGPPPWPIEAAWRVDGGEEN